MICLICACVCVCGRERMYFVSFVVGRSVGIQLEYAICTAAMRSSGTVGVNTLALVVLPVVRCVGWCDR